MPHNPYPLPAYAASIWIAGDQLMLALPPATDAAASRTHTIPIPLAKCQVERTMVGAPASHHAGFAALLSILHARDAARRSPCIGEAGAPPRYDLEQMLRGMQSTRYNSRGEVASTTLADLGLADSSDASAA